MVHTFVKLRRLFLLKNIVIPTGNCLLYSSITLKVDAGIQIQSKPLMKTIYYNKRSNKTCHDINSTEI